MNAQLTRSRTRSARMRRLGWLAVVTSIAIAMLAPSSVLGRGNENNENNENNIKTCPEGYSTIFLNGGNQPDTTGSADGVTVNVTYSAVGGNSTASVAFTASGGLVWIAYIKGGNDYSTYDYVSVGGVSSDSGLVAPLVGNGNTPNVSHSVFCVRAETGGGETGGETNPATLTVIKHVVNDNGGDANASDFTMNVTATNASPTSFDGNEAGTTVTLDAGNYTVSEGDHTGYNVTYSAGCTGTIGAGDTATCTITNHDIALETDGGTTNGGETRPGTLTVIKHVINDNGGTAVASDFSFSVEGGTAVAFEADGQNDLSVAAGTYSVTESAAAGYTTTYENCSQVEIASSGTATCTITNDDIATETGGGEGGPVTIVVATPTPTPPATPDGGVLGATATPHLTLPPTSTLGEGSTPSSNSWRLVLIGFAALMAGFLVLAPGDRRVRNR